MLFMIGLIIGVILGAIGMAILASGAQADERTRLFTAMVLFRRWLHCPPAERLDLIRETEGFLEGGE